MAREFVITRRVQFAETDMASVLHFANFYRLMEEVEHAFWRSYDLSVMTEENGHVIGWPRVSTSCDYFQPLRFEEEV
ncbi:MAG: hotdog domain-containing protein, partial [Phycisphaerae bacterium]